MGPTRNRFARRAPALRRPASGGFALLTVLFVLLFLLVFCAPFLMTARNADQASAQLSDRAQARIAVESAARHARAVLQASHIAVDETVYFDSQEELAVDNRFPDAFLDARDARGVMWDVAALDLAGMIDLNSASPQVIGNVLGLVTRLSSVTEAEATELVVASTAGFESEGFLVIDGEVVHYQAKDASRFLECTRSVGVKWNRDNVRIPSGPLAAETHGVGTTVIDQRAFAPVHWRSASRDGQARFLDAEEQVRESALFAMAGELGDGMLAGLADQCSVYSGVRGGSPWQWPVRLRRPLAARVSQEIVVESPRWFASGATVQVSDGIGSEVFFVRHRSDSGKLFLDRPVARDYDAWTTSVRVLARRPVNLNTASPEVLNTLFANVQLKGVNSRVTRAEARSMAALVVASRPITGHEDFLRRVILPAAGIEPLPSDAAVIPAVFEADGQAGLIDESDALALYANGLNANDSMLAFGTMPYGFTSRDVFRLDLRSSINAPTGVERVALTGERVEVIVPQSELFSVWARQEDFDEALRLTRQSPWWLSGPRATTQHDGVQPPSRLNAHFGTRGGRPFVPGDSTALEAGGGQVAGGAESEADAIQHVFASRDDDGWLQLAPARVAEYGDRLRRMEHFDHETRALEGRYLPDETLNYETADEIVQWTGTTSAADGLLRPLSFSAWIQPQSLDGGILLDVGAAGDESDRVSLELEEGDLVLRVYDGFGDHRDTELKEVGEVRYAVAEQGPDPGLPADTWHHVQIDVRGNRPDQMSMVVNGSTQGVRTPGMTRLNAALDESALFVSVESTEGFPDQGVLRVGNELVEYVSRSGAGFTAQHYASGELAGFGGRGARSRYQLDGDTLSAPSGPSLFHDESASLPAYHQSGASVSLYGYAQPLSSPLTTAGVTLPELGSFRAARVVGTIGGPADGDTIVVGANLEPFTVQGFEAGGLTRVEGLVLADADSSAGGVQYLEAFPEGGGYVALIQGKWGHLGQAESNAGGTLGGVEVIRYGSRAGPNLTNLTRGHLTGLTNVGAQDPNFSVGGTRAYVLDWKSNYRDSDNRPLSTIYEAGVFVVPLSIPVSGWSTATQPDRSDFVQITERANAELTEWVRYDEVGVSSTGSGAHLVRDSVQALFQTYTVVTGRRGLGEVGAGSPDPPPPGNDDDGGGGLGGSNGATGGDGGSEQARSGAPAPPGPAAASVAVQGGGGASGLWQTELGVDELTDFPLSRALGAALRFRGVLGTHPQAHRAGSVLVPVFEIKDRGANRGRPGRFDRVFIAPHDDPTSIGFTASVHRGHWPADDSPRYGWAWNTGAAVNAPIEPGLETVNEELEVGEYTINGVMYLAFEAPLPVPLEPTDPDPGRLEIPDDTRLLSRISKFPSGERPRLVDTVGVGTSFRPNATSVVPSAVIDEIVFGTPIFAEKANDHSLQGAQLILTQPFNPNSTNLVVDPGLLRVPGGTVRRGSPLDELPEGGGLLRIGNEILAYETRDASTGDFYLGFSGRGLLGSQPQAHDAGELVTWLESWPVSTLATAITASDSTIPVADLQTFPFQGTLLIDNELVHYTRKRDGSLEMPRASQQPGLMDEKGDGLFRGRFGTEPSAHNGGAPAILFPIRYWDRWADRADAPELACFGFEFDQPGAWWKAVHWEAESAGHGGVQMGVLQRTDASVPWDSDPELQDGLDLMWEGEDAGGMVPVARQSDRIEWRIFARYDPGAFDPVGGYSHAWKETPRFRRIALSYLAPGRVLRSVRQ